jgi:hypothetical protein
MTVAQSYRMAIILPFLIIKVHKVLEVDIAGRDITLKLYDFP